MDHTTQIIADYVDAMAADALPERVLHEAKRRLVDTLGCAIGALDSEPARIARSLAGDVTGTFSATAIGLPRPTTVEMATFTNTVMVRYLDYNDTYFAPTRGGGGHPSDLIPTSLAVGQAVGASGLEVLLSIIVAYEVSGALAGGVHLRERGLDQGLHVVVASAMAAGKLLGLTRDQLGHAVALAVTPHVPTRQTRVGELSMWKGCATAGAARNGTFAALLASRGMTGPPEPYEGGDGIWERITGPFELTLPAQPGAFVLENVCTKTRPAEYNSQGPLDLILDLRDRVDLDDLERIDVETYWLTFSEIGSEPAKWDPQTRETADHSLPYLLAVALVDGKIDLQSFTPERIGYPKLRPLMNRIHIVENKDFSQRFPNELMCRISIQSRSGKTITQDRAYPRGHARDPWGDSEVNRKFDSLVDLRGPAGAAICREVRDALWQLDAVPNVSPLLQPLGEL